jgi:hypothetical protein
LEAINAALEAFAIEQSKVFIPFCRSNFKNIFKEQMRAKELEVSHPSNPPNPGPEPEAPQPSKGKNNS